MPSFPPLLLHLCFSLFIYRKEYLFWSIFFHPLNITEIDAKPIQLFHVSLPVRKTGEGNMKFWTDWQLWEKMCFVSYIWPTLAG